MPTIKYPDIEVNFSSFGTNANIFSYVGIIAESLRQHHSNDKATEFVNDIQKASDYEDAKKRCAQWVTVTW